MRGVSGGRAYRLRRAARFAGVSPSWACARFPCSPPRLLQKYSQRSIRRPHRVPIQMPVAGDAGSAVPRPPERSRYRGRHPDRSPSRRCNGRSATTAAARHRPSSPGVFARSLRPPTRDDSDFPLRSSGRVMPSSANDDLLSIAATTRDYIRNLRDGGRRCRPRAITKIPPLSRSERYAICLPSGENAGWYRPRPSLSSGSPTRCCPSAADRCPSSRLPCSRTPPSCRRRERRETAPRRLHR